MANHRLIHHPIAQGLLAIFILTTSCTDEVQQPRLENRISFHTEIQNTWISFDQNERRAETRSTDLPYSRTVEPHFTCIHFMQTV